MILPTHGIPPERCLIGVGAVVLKHLSSPKSVGALWTAVSEDERDDLLTYQWFILALDVLFALGLVNLAGGRLQRVGTWRSP